MKLSEEQIKNIKSQSHRTRDLMETLDKEFTELAESFGLRENAECPTERSAWYWLYDAVFNFPPVNLENVEGFEKCIEVIGERLEEIEKLKVLQ